MKISELLPILKQVLTNPYVIGTAVVVILFMNFCSFVCNYKKRPPKGKKKNAKKRRLSNLRNRQKIRSHLLNPPAKMASLPAKNKKSNPWNPEKLDFSAEPPLLFFFIMIFRLFPYFQPSFPRPAADFNFF